MKKLFFWLKNKFPFLLSFMLLLILWNSVSRSINSPLILPAPHAVFSEILSYLASPEFYWNFLQSIHRFFISFTFSMILGCILGFFCGKSVFFNNFLRLPVTILRTTPIVAIILLLVFALKSDFVPVAVSILMTLPVVISSVSSGFVKKDDDLKLLQMAKIFNFTKKQKFLYIFLPRLMPFFKNAFISCFGMTWKVIAAGEVLCLPQKAIGSMLAKAQVHLETEKVFAITIILVFFCYCTEKICRILLFSLPSFITGKTKLPAVKNFSTEDFFAEKQPEPIELKNISFSYGENQIFDKYSVSFGKGTVNAVFAPSGKGKTTLLNYIAENFSGVSYCFQEPRLIENKTCLFNVALPLFNLTGKETAFKIAGYFLKETGLYDKLNEKVQNLSGGQKQRVNLARSLAFPSQILLLDEPFSSLDEENRRRIIKFLSDFLSNGKKTVIFVTHNKKEAELLNCKSYSL